MQDVWLVTPSWINIINSLRSPDEFRSVRFCCPLPWKYFWFQNFVGFRTEELRSKGGGQGPEASRLSCSFSVQVSRSKVSLLTNIYWPSAIHWRCLWAPWSRVIQWLFLILTISCEVLTCMITHSLPLPRPSLGRWGSCRGQWKVMEPLLKNMWVTWWRSQEEIHPLEAKTNLPIANVTQIILTGSATEG